MCGYFPIVVVQLHIRCRGRLSSIGVMINDPCRGHRHFFTKGQLLTSKLPTHSYINLNLHGSHHDLVQKYTAYTRLIRLIFSPKLMSHLGKNNAANSTSRLYYRYQLLSRKCLFAGIIRVYFLSRLEPVLVFDISYGNCSHRTPA